MKKTTLTALLCLLVAIMPMSLSSQTNIQSAFDAIIKSSDAQIVERHTLDRNPETGVKIGQSDTYRFTLPDNKLKLVKNVLAAFDKDRDLAYSFNSGTTEEHGEISLAVGNDGNKGIYISEPGQDYVYALFLAPKSEDPAGISRYAYSIGYKHKGDKIQGKLVVTYATTLKHRQDEAQKAKKRMFNFYANNSEVTTVKGNQSWFSTLMSYLQGMTKANTHTRIAFATKAYELIKDTKSYPEVTEQDKNAAREILKSMLSEKNTLTNRCLVSFSMPAL